MNIIFLFWSYSCCALLCPFLVERKTSNSEGLIRRFKIDVWCGLEVGIHFATVGRRFVRLIRLILLIKEGGFVCFHAHSKNSRAAPHDLSFVSGTFLRSRTLFRGRFRPSLRLHLINRHSAVIAESAVATLLELESFHELVEAFRFKFST